MKLSIVAIVVCVLAATAAAQPSDAQLKKDLAEPGQVSIKLSSKPGTVQLNTDTRNYEYVRGVEILQTTEWPGIKVLVVGDAVYQRTGGGFRYWKFRVVENRFQGIPNPSPDDIDAVLDREPTAWFGGGMANVIVKVHDRPRLSASPGWTWHTPLSVSFLMQGKIDVVANNTTIETRTQNVEIRLYRDDMKGAWKSYMSSKRDHKALSTQQHSADEIRRMPNLKAQASERASQERAATLPVIVVPAFADHGDLALFVHDVLRSGPRERAEATLRAVIAPRHLAPGSTTRLAAHSEEMVQQALDSAFADKSSYRQQYCAKPETETRGSRDRTYVVGVRPDLISEYVVVKGGGQLRDGVKIDERWVLDDLAVRTTRKADTLEWIASFSDPAKLCPND